MKHLTIIIEKAATNYAAYIEGVDGIAVTGRTIDGIRKEMEEAIRDYIEVSKELGTEIPEALQGEHVLEFEMDTQTLLNYYDGIIGKPALEKLTGIDQKQLWHYASGRTKPRPAQRKKIAEGLHNLGEELSLIKV